MCRASLTEKHTTQNARRTTFYQLFIIVLADKSLFRLGLLCALLCSETKILGRSGHCQYSNIDCPSFAEGLGTRING